MKTCAYCGKKTSDAIEFKDEYTNFGWFCNDEHVLKYLVKLNREATEKAKKRRW